jgi:hypothetical protein
MDVVKCLVEGVPFFCHINEGEMCAGYVLLLSNEESV